MCIGSLKMSIHTFSRCVCESIYSFSRSMYACLYEYICNICKIDWIVVCASVLASMSMIFVLLL